MATEKRFKLMSFHWTDASVVIYDNLERRKLNLSIYKLIELLNKVSQSEYDFRKNKEKPKKEQTKAYKELEKIFKEKGIFIEEMPEIICMLMW